MDRDSYSSLLLSPFTFSSYLGKWIKRDNSDESFSHESSSFFFANPNREEREERKRLSVSKRNKWVTRDRRYHRGNCRGMRSLVFLKGGGYCIRGTVCVITVLAVHSRRIGQLYCQGVNIEQRRTSFHSSIGRFPIREKKNSSIREQWSDPCWQRICPPRNCSWLSRSTMHERNQWLKRNEGLSLLSLAIYPGSFSRFFKHLYMLFNRWSKGEKEANKGVRDIRGWPDAQYRFSPCFPDRAESEWANPLSSFANFSAYAWADLQRLR